MILSPFSLPLYPLSPPPCQANFFFFNLVFWIGNTFISNIKITESYKAKDCLPPYPSSFRSFPPQQTSTVLSFLSSQIYLCINQSCRCILFPFICYIHDSLFYIQIWYVCLYSSVTFPYWFIKNSIFCFSLEYLIVWIYHNWWSQLSFDKHLDGFWSLAITDNVV